MATMLRGDLAAARKVWPDEMKHDSAANWRQPERREALQHLAQHRERKTVRLCANRCEPVTQLAK